jgi:hypothetical protein
MGILHLFCALIVALLLIHELLLKVIIGHFQSLTLFWDLVVSFSNRAHTFLKVSKLFFKFTQLALKLFDNVFFTTDSLHVVIYHVGLFPDFICADVELWKRILKLLAKLVIFAGELTDFSFEVYDVLLHLDDGFPADHVVSFQLLDLVPQHLLKFIASTLNYNAVSWSTGAQLVLLGCMRSKRVCKDWLFREPNILRGSLRCESDPKLVVCWCRSDWSIFKFVFLRHLLLQTTVRWSYRFWIVTCCPWTIHNFVASCSHSLFVDFSVGVAPWIIIW